MNKLLAYLGFVGLNLVMKRNYHQASVMSFWTWYRALSWKEIMNKLLACHPGNMGSNILMKWNYHRASAMYSWQNGIENCHETKLSPSFYAVLLETWDWALSWKEYMNNLLSSHLGNMGSSAVRKQNYHKTNWMLSWLHGIEHCHETTLSKCFWTVILITWNPAFYEEKNEMSFWSQGFEHTPKTKLSPNFCTAIFVIKGSYMVMKQNHQQAFALSS